jgi:hypothetical protein
MRRFLTWLGIGAGALVILRRRLRRRKLGAVAVDHAEELKRKLAESRADEAEAEDVATAEPEAGKPKPSLDERRRAVHDRARQAIDEMLGGEDIPHEESE